MNGIVFQEMREARGLAYSASASYTEPEELGQTVVFMDFIQTQNDKLTDALSAFEEIINNMPQSQTAFDIAKESRLTNMRTRRVVKSNVLWRYIALRKLGLDHDISRDAYEKIQELTLDDVVAFQQQNVKDRNYHICILGRESDFDIEGLSKYGEIRRLSTEDIFGY